MATANTGILREVAYGRAMLLRRLVLVSKVISMLQFTFAKKLG